MAKEIVTWCEVHLQSKEERVPGIEHQITLNGKSAVLDLCEDCRGQYLAPFKEVLVTYAEEVAPKATKKKSSGGSSKVNKWTPDADGKFRCKVIVSGDQQCGREFDTAQGMGRHALSHEN